MANKLIVSDKRIGNRYRAGTYWKSELGGYYILVELSNRIGFAAVNIVIGNTWLGVYEKPEDAVSNLEFVGDVELTIKAVN